MRATESFWAGDFGNAYNKRAPGDVEANISFFRRALQKVAWINSAVELGCGVGANLLALKRVAPHLELTGVEINEEAAAQAANHAPIHRCSLLDWEPSRAFDLALTKGVLIHIAPPDLRIAYEKLMASSRRWILLAEYYNPTPIEIEYRGHAGRLWKRDFATDLIERYPGLVRVADYGFAWRRDPVAPQDDITWFLMEKC